MDYTVHLAIGIEHIKKAFLDAKSRGARIRYLTEITIDNISYSKMLRKIVDGMKGNFMISEITSSIHGMKGNSMISEITRTRNHKVVQNLRRLLTMPNWYC